jgi:hypothetical protein
MTFFCKYRTEIIKPEIGCPKGSKLKILLFYSQ